MDISTLIESFAEFAKQKNIDRPTMIRILEDVFRNMIKKKYGVDENGKIVVRFKCGHDNRARALFCRTPPCIGATAELCPLHPLPECC